MKRAMLVVVGVLSLQAAPAGAAAGSDLKVKPAAAPAAKPAK